MGNNKNSERYTNIGKRVPKFDALEKVTGQAVYPQDLRFPGMLYSKILWSEHAHAEILEINTKDAEQLPGVYAVITAKNMPFVSLFIPVHKYFFSIFFQIFDYLVCLA